MKMSFIEADIVAVRSIARAQKITQNEISKAIGASQSQVSRVLSGESIKRSKLKDEVCKYVNRAAQTVSIESVRRNDELMAAWAATWDGTPQNSAALAAVIRSLRVLTPSLPRLGRN